MKVIEPEDSRPYARLYRATIDEAVGGSGALMHRLVAHVRTELRERETEAPDRRERERMTHSRRLLNQHENMLCDRFSEELLTAFTRQSSFEYAMPAPSSLHFDQVGGMNEAQMLDSVEAARVQRSVHQAATGALDELNGLICTLIGQPVVRLERNPLRPSVYVEAVTAALSHLPVPPSLRMAWISMMSRALGHELDLYYRSLCEDLRERGVGSSGGALSGPARSAQPAAHESPMVLTLDKLRRFLAQSAGSGTAGLSQRFDLGETQAAVTIGPEQTEQAQPEPVPTGFDATVPAAFDALQDMRQVDEVLQRIEQARSGDAAAAAGDALALMRASAAGPDQALAIEVVALMIDNIRHDTRLLGPVQQLISELEPALLRLALVDPRFFSHRQHPARRLLHEIAHRSIAYESEDSRGFSGFMAPLREAVGPLANAPISTAEPFDQALSRLVALLDDPSGRDQRRVERAVDALRQAEQRHMLAETIVTDVRERTELEPLPAVLQDFLCGPWAQVVAQARIADTTGADDPGGFAAVIEELLAIGRGAEAPASLSARLRAGLATIAFPEERAQSMFDYLERPQIRAQALAEPPVRRAPDSIWIAPTEAQASGFVEVADAALVTGSGTGLPMLELGTWVALLSEGQWTRTRLGWSSPGGSLLLFTDALGFMQSLSRRACDQMLASGQLRVLSTDPVEDALDAVAQTALRNSVDIHV